MKIFTTIKVGYTSGTYGNTGEYFVTIIVNNRGMFSVAHKGQYGSDYRVQEPLLKAGYTNQYSWHDYGRMTTKDMIKHFKSEYEAIDAVKEIIRPARKKVEA